MQRIFTSSSLFLTVPLLLVEKCFNSTVFRAPKDDAAIEATTPGVIVLAHCRCATTAWIVPIKATNQTVKQKTATAVLMVKYGVVVASTCRTKMTTQTGACLMEAVSDCEECCLV